MPGIKIHGDDHFMRGAVMFFDAAVGAYLNKHQERPDLKFALLRDMRAADNLFLTDVRMANPAKGVKHHEIELAGFQSSGRPVCFKIRMDESMKMTGFAKKNLENMSDNTKEMVKSIQEEMGLVARGPALK
ncbi:hypothetical protein [Legionella sp. CNM-4043-24]|uniref:hypothetical protein n=1 Tax=Legionella sp. CNM-4043-24 TaxID=3421646 RepID=UPI00403AB7E9